MIAFSAPLELHGKTATGIAVPAEKVEALGSGKRPKVYATLNGFTYRTTVAPMSGSFFLPVSAEVRASAGIVAEQIVQVELRLDKDPREVEVPADFAEALASHPEAKARFERLSYSHQKEHVRAIEEAKSAVTRTRRIEKALDMLTT